MGLLSPSIYSHLHPICPGSGSSILPNSCNILSISFCHKFLAPPPSFLAPLPTSHLPYLPLVLSTDLPSDVFCIVFINGIQMYFFYNWSTFLTTLQGPVHASSYLPKSPGVQAKTKSPFSKVIFIALLS